MRFDPIEFQVLWSRLVSASDEMAVALVRTAFSPAVSDGRDFACALYDSDGKMLAQSTHCTPGLIGAMPRVVRAFLDEYPVSSVEPGDAFICNDPWLGSGHTPDIYVASPIFAGSTSTLVGFAATAAHHIDVGGRIYSPDSTEVYEEGLMIPPMKWMERGQVNSDLFRLIERNVRLPDEVFGDLRAQIAANNVGAKRVVDLLEDRHLESLVELGNQIIDHTEGSMRAALSEIASGTYQHDVILENHDPARDPLRIRTQLSLSDGEIVADFSGTSMQVDRPINCVLNYTLAYTVFALKSALHPHLPNNEGSFRPITLEVPEANILNAQFPAPVMLRTSLAYYALEALYGALADPAPEKVLAPSGTYPLWIVIFSGHDDRDQRFVYIFWGNGGQGARADRDGLSAVVFPPNTTNTPVELFENETPLLCETKAFICDSGGPGRHRGGVGQHIRVRNLASRPVSISAIGGRYLAGAPGIQGGLPGRRGRIQLGTGDPLTHDQELELLPDQILAMDFPGGGGFGPPWQRNVDLVAEDVRKGLVSVSSAAKDYGVVIDPVSRSVDEPETQRARATMKQEA